MATASAWAQNCTYPIQNIVSTVTTKFHDRSFWDGGDYYQFEPNTIIGSVDNIYGISKVTAVVTLERTNGGQNAKVKLEYSINNGTWVLLGSEKELAGLKLAWETDNKLEISQNVNISAGNVVRFRICETSQKEYGASRQLTISNFNVTMASTLKASTAILDFGAIEEGQSLQREFKVIYSNVGGITASSNSDVFTVSPTSSSTPCEGSETFYVTFTPKESGSYDGKITLRSHADNNVVAEVAVTGKATGEPEHRWDGETAFLVDETVDLSTWYSSNKDGARTYEIVSFSAYDETGVTPTLNGNTIKLTRAGELTVRMKQDAYDIYSYKESTQTFKISKYDSNFQWNNPDNLQCYVDDYCNEAALFSRASDLPLTITSSNPNVVSYQDGTFTAVGAGTAVITVKQDKHYKWTEFEETYTIHVNKYDVSATIAQESALWNELINNAFFVSYGLQDYTVTSSNTNIAQYLSGNKIQTYFTSGTVQFRIFRAEDRKYKELNKTLPLEVNPAGGCLVLEPCSGSYSAESFGSYEPAGFTGVPNQLTFKAENQYVLGLAGRGSIVVQQYLNNGWTDITSIAWEELGKDYDSEGLKPFGPYNLDEKATKVRFYTRNGTYKRYFQDVQVTRKVYLRPSTKELTLPQTNIGKSSEKTFDLSWSTCSNDIKLVSNNDLFELGTTQINSTAHTGTTNNILVRFKGANEPGTYSAIITIYDQSQSKEVNVSCVVKDRLTTKIEYTGELQYSEAHDCMYELFSVKVDDTGNTVSDAKISLTSSNEDILSICDNAGFMPHCGGKVTLTAKYAGDETYAPTEWSREITVANCYQTIDWEQDFRQFIAAEDGTISQRIELTAKAVPTDFAITYELDEAAQKFASLENQDGNWFLVIFGVGTGHIIANAPSGTYETKYYDAASLMHEIRVRKWRDKCNTDESVASDEITLSALFSLFYDDEEVIGLDGRPYERMEFYSHVSSGSGKNELTVSFSADGGATWSNSQTYTIPETYDWNTPYIHANVPEGANQVKFKTTSTGMTYFNMVKMVQKTYLEPNVTEIRIDDAIVNQQFSREFKVKYSDIPLLQHVISDSHDLGLKLTSTPPVANDCGDWGEYTFTLTGESPYPQDVTETITFYTSAGDEVKIPVTITATLSEPFYFNVTENGDWKNPTNWTHKNSTTHGMLPDERFPIVVSKTLKIGTASLARTGENDDLEAYGVTIEENGNITVLPTGGLTLHAGGFTEGVNENNLTVCNDQTGVGYVRVSPYFTRAAGGTMPNITVQYTTRAKAGGAKDQVWQYVGAPGDNMQMSNDGVMVYLWSEKEGWVYSSTNMTPFAGYALTRTASGSETYKISAQPINGDHTIDLTYTQGAMEGGNLFVNSYLAPIDVTKFTDDTNDFEGDIEKTFYLFNSGSWDQWQGQGGSTNTMVNGSSAGQYYAIAPFSAEFTASEEQKVIPPMQGVYVVVGENGGKIKLQYNKHVFRADTKDMNRPMRAPQEDLENFMRLRLQVNSQNSGADRMYVIQHENTTRGYDNGYDAKNILAEGQANIYTNEVDGQMEISVADQIDSTFIGFAAGEDSEYTLTFNSLVGQDMYLHDIEADSLFLLTEDGQYVFTAQPNSMNDMRFQLLLYPDFSDDEPGSGVTTSVDNLLSSAQVWMNNKRVYIASAPQNSTLSVYTVSGMAITSPLTIHNAPCTIDLSHLPNGVYVLRLNNQAYKFVCK